MNLTPLSRAFKRRLKPDIPTRKNKLKNSTFRHFFAKIILDNENSFVVILYHSRERLNKNERMNKMEKITIDFTNANDDLFAQLFKTKENKNGFILKTENGFLVQDESGNTVDNFGSVILDKPSFFAKRGYTQEMDSRARTEKEFALFNEIVAEFLAFQDELKSAGVKVRRFGEVA